MMVHICNSISYRYILLNWKERCFVKLHNATWCVFPEMPYYPCTHISLAKVNYISLCHFSEEQNAISSCAPKQETQKFWWADVYHKNRTSYFEGKKSDIQRHSQLRQNHSFCLIHWNVKLLNLYYFPLWCFVWHIFTIALISMLHTEQTYFLLKLM